MSWLSGLFGGGDKKSDAPQPTSTYQVYDPVQEAKNAVATPLSDFLKTQPGVGIGQFPTDPNYTNRYNEFLSMNPEQYFQNNISDPAYQQFTKYAKPLIDEGYAGSLRGSGHYGAQEAGYVGLGEQLGNTAAQFIPQFAQSQLQAGQTEFARQYSNWYQSLPQTNPALAQAINFLNSGKQNTDYNQFAPPGGPGLLDQLSGSLLSGSLGSIGQPSGGFNTQTGQPNKTSFGDATYKNPQFWVSLATALGSACWVASEIYGGWTEPRTICARVYVNLLSPKWFRKLYYRFGERIAALIKKFPVFKLILIPIFDNFSEIGFKFLKGVTYGL